MAELVQAESDIVVVESPSGEYDFGKYVEVNVDDDTNKLEYFLGLSGHVSVDCPFMANNPSNEKVIDNVLNDKMEQLNGLLPDNLAAFYKHIGSSSQEIYIHNWTFILNLDFLVF